MAAQTISTIKELEDNTLNGFDLKQAPSEEEGNLHQSSRQNSKVIYLCLFEIMRIDQAKFRKWSETVRAVHHQSPLHDDVFTSPVLNNRNARTHKNGTSHQIISQLQMKLTMRIITLPILSILIVSSQAIGGLKGTSHQSLTSRILEDWNDDIANYSYHFEIESNARSEADPTNSSSISGGGRTVNVTHIQEMIVNQAQKYKEAAESKAWEFYQSSPSEWTESQWDFVFILFGALLLLSCCCLSAFCTYCCIYRRDDKDGPSANKDEYAKRMWYNRLKKHRSRYRKDRYEEKDADTIESQPTFDTFDSGASISVASTFEMTRKNDKKESLLKKSGKEKKTKQTKGSYESPKNKGQDAFQQSPGSTLSTFEMENEMADTPKKKNGRSRSRVEC
jgi:hypothetical protein